jgi:MscS family membrane protein
VSAAPSGATNDGLGSGVEEIARVPIDAGLTAPVRLVHRGPADARWQFSRVTVAHIDEWYDRLPLHWLLGWVPKALLRMGPYNLLWAQWAVLPLFFLLVWFAGLTLDRASRRILKPVARRSRVNWHDAWMQQLASPLTFAFSLLVAYLLTPILGLYAPSLTFMHRAIKGLFLATFFWGLARSVDIAGQLFAQSQWGHGAPATRALLLFGSRVGKSMVAAFALLTLFTQLGYPVTSLLAGLGVGGIAVALSAQKSLENLIGAFAIAVDQPFREGDFVRVDGITGTVELIGMRSTRIRTPDRTLVSIPNGKLADMRIESFAPRDRVRLAFTFGLTYDTTHSQLGAVLKGFDDHLREHPKLWPNTSSVRFTELGESALRIEVECVFGTRDYGEFTVIRQQVLLELMAIVEREGAQFAFPTRTLHWDGPAAQSSSSSG